MNRNKKLMAKAGVTVLCAAMITNSLAASTWAATEPEKDENVYVNLNMDGSVSGVYVVNEYHLDEDTAITDYGNYTSVQNLSSDDAITLDGDKVSVSAPAGKFYYQGNLSDTTIPWDIQITYKMDGKELSAEEVAGKSGKLEIMLSVKDNKKSDDEFFDNYLVQGTVTLDTKKCSNIQADGATQANVGSDRQLLYNIMAGQEKEFTITADVTDFEMDAISFQAVPMSFAIDRDSMDLDELYDKTDEIKDAADEFDDGATDLQDGAGELLDGSNELKDGAKELSDGAGDLKSGTDQVKSGVQSLAEGASKVASGNASLSEGLSTLSSSLKKMQKGSTQLNTALTQLAGQSDTLTGGSSEVLAALQQIQNSMAAIDVGTQEMQEKTASLSQSEEMTQLLAASSQINSGITDLSTGISGVSEGLNNMQAQYDNLGELKTQNSNGAAYLRGIAQKATAAYAGLSDAQKKMVDQLGDINGVAGNLNNIATLLETNNSTYDALGNANASLAAGAGEAAAGAASLSENYQQFDAQIQTMPILIQNLMTGQMSELKTAIDTLEAEYEKLDQGIGTYTDGVNQVQKAYAQMYEAYGQVVTATEQLAGGAKKAATGSSSLAKGSQTLVSGSDSLSDGAGTLADGAGSLYDGTVELTDGVTELSDGTQDLKDGTTEFKDKTSDIDTQIEDAIDDAIAQFSGEDFTPVSFASEENTQIGLVQFAMKTNAIEIKEVETEAETEEVDNSILGKLKNLF